jgi:hypothetical protein
MIWNCEINGKRKGKLFPSNRSKELALKIFEADLNYISKPAEEVRSKQLFDGVKIAGKLLQPKSGSNRPLKNTGPPAELQH